MKEICYIVYVRDPITGQIMFASNVYMTLPLAEREVSCHCSEVGEFNNVSGISISKGACGELWLIERHYLVKP